MNAVPGFRATICTYGKETAFKEAEDTQGIVIFWHHGKRMLAIFHPEKVVEFPFETRKEVSSIYATLKHFKHPCVY